MFLLFYSVFLEMDFLYWWYQFLMFHPVFHSTYLWNWSFELPGFWKNESNVNRCARWRWLMISIYYRIGFTVRTGTVKNQLAFIIPFWPIFSAYTGTHEHGDAQGFLYIRLVSMNYLKIILCKYTLVSMQKLFFSNWIKHFTY